MFAFFGMIFRGLKAGFDGFCQFVTAAAEAQPKVVGIIILALVVFAVFF